MSDVAGNDGGKKNEFSYNYDSNAHERKSSDKVPFFNGTETAYPFLKTKMYNHNSTPPSCVFPPLDINNDIILLI
jgi:hypothetical protein